MNAQRTGVVSLPLHGGKAPPWLFQRMVRLSRAMVLAIVEEHPWRGVADLTHLQSLDLPAHHYLGLEDLNPQRLSRILLSTYERKPRSFEALLSLEGVGPKTIRALSLVAELVYGVPLNHRDPALYTFAHGGKDGHPYPVDRRLYDQTVATLTEAVQRAWLGDREKLEALRRLASPAG